MNRYFVSPHCTVTFILLSTFQHTMFNYTLLVTISKIKEHSTLDHNDHCSAMLRKPKSPLKVARTALQALKEGIAMAMQCRWWPGAGAEILKTHQHSMENAANVQYFWQKMEVLYVPICAELKTCGGGSQGRNWSWRPPQSSPGTRGHSGVSQLLIYIYHQHHNESIKHWAHDRRHSRFEYQ